MANPRKFSEKIALHRQRQAEEQSQYERVLMEVRAVTQNPIPQSGQILPTRMSNHMLANNLLERTRGGGNESAMRNACMWSSMPNIHSAVNQHQPAHAQPTHHPQQQVAHQHGGGIHGGNGGFYGSSHSMRLDATQNNAFRNDNGMFYEQSNGPVSPLANQNVQVMNHQPVNHPVFLEPPNWPMQGTSQTMPGNAASGNGIYGNGNLPRCYSENNLFHQSTPNIKIKTMNLETNVKQNANGQLIHLTRDQPMRDRRLRPPETPQGAPCGSLPDLNKLVIPKNTSRPSSAKSAQGVPAKESYEVKRRVESPRVMRERVPSNPPSNVGSPRSHPRRQHPYRIDSAGNRLSWNLTGSSPSSPVSATSQRGFNSNSLPSSPQTPRTNETFAENGFLKENIAECLNSPSPVPEIVLTPSEYPSNCHLGGMSTDHPLQLSGFNPSSPGGYFGSAVSSPSSMTQEGAHVMEFTNSSSSTPSMPSNFTYLSEMNSIPTPAQGDSHQSHDIPALKIPNQQQLELLENGKLSFDNL